MATIQTVIVLALAIAAASCTVSLSTIFKPMHAWIGRRDGAVWAWCGKLLGCPYCVTHWLAFGATAIYRPRLVDLWMPLDLAVTALALVALAMLPVLVIRRAISPVLMRLDAPPPRPTRLATTGERARVNGRVVA